MLIHRAVTPTLHNRKDLINFYGAYADGTVRNDHYDLYFKSDKKPDWLK